MPPNYSRNYQLTGLKVTFLTKLNIEMNLASLLGKVVKRSTQQRRAVPYSLDTPMPWQPRPPSLGVDLVPDALRGGESQWLGSAKDLMMPPAPPPSKASCPGRGGGQMGEGRSADASFGGSTAVGTGTAEGSSGSVGNGDVGGSGGKERGEGSGEMGLRRVSSVLGG